MSNPWSTPRARAAAMAALILLALTASPLRAGDKPGKSGDANSGEAPAWVKPMRDVHAKFTGKPGTLALFGDSITVSQAFWTPINHERRKISPEGRAAFELVNGYMRKECWAEWRGPDKGNDGGRTILWARENVDNWLKALNPDAAVIMFGTNDLGGVSLVDYEQATRQVVQKCLDNGTVPLLTTPPPRSGRFEDSKKFAEAVRKVAAELKVPLIDYWSAVTERRPSDWDGAMEQFKDPDDRNEYNVETLISRDGVHPSFPEKYRGDFSEEALKRNGYNLRTYVTLLGYADVIRHVLKPQ